MATDLLLEPADTSGADPRSGHEVGAADRPETAAVETGAAQRGSAPLQAPSPRALRNIRMMHLLERIAAAFNEADMPLMVLKGAALNLVLYERPDERPMADLDLLVRTEQVERSLELLEAIGALRSQTLVREDFFPRYYYEIECTAGDIDPVTVDLHVRPFRPLRYSRMVPDDFLWERARPVRMGKASVLIPCPDDMLIHLAAHAAIHGNAQGKWLEDIKRWTDAWKNEIPWDRFVATAEAWHLSLPVEEGIRAAERTYGPVCPPEITRRLEQVRVNWRDRLALRQAPRDNEHPVAHVLVNVLTTPQWRFTLGYLLAVVFPDRSHMGEWYFRRHTGWLTFAHLCRFLKPITTRTTRLRTWFTKIEIRKSPIHGIGVFAARNIEARDLIARFRGRIVDREGIYVSHEQDESGNPKAFEITGNLKFLNHSCHPNAELAGFRLTALQHIPAGREITIRYGDCQCAREKDTKDQPPR